MSDDRYDSHPDDYDPPVYLAKPNPAPSYSTPSDAPSYAVPGATQSNYPAALNTDAYGRSNDRMSRLAIAGFILSIVSVFLNFLGLSQIVALILSIVALNRDVKKRGLRGRGFAIAGIIISILSLIFLVIVIIGAIAYVNQNCTATADGHFACNSNSAYNTSGSLGTR